MRSFCTAKAPHTFSSKFGSDFAYIMFEITNDLVSFELPGPELFVYVICALVT